MVRSNSRNVVRRRGLLYCSCTVFLLWTAGCSDFSSSADAADLASVRLLQAHHGRLVDIYGVRTIGDSRALELFRRDVLIGYESVTGPGSPAGDEVRWLGTNPDTLQRRLVIEHPPGSRGFAAAFDGLQARVRNLHDGDRVSSNAAIRLTFSGELVSSGRSGLPVGFASLRVDSQSEGTRPVPARIAARGAEVIIDPVLLGSEALAMDVAPTPDGIPVAPEALSSVVLELRLPAATDGSNLQPDSKVARLHQGSAGSSLQLRFSAAGGSSGGGAGGGEDTTGPRLLGHLPFYLQRVDSIDPRTQQVTLFKNGIGHDIDAGDVIRLFIDNSGVPVLVTDIIADPADDDGRPGVQHVRALVAFTPGLRQNDPRNLPGYPVDPTSAAGRAWLVQNAPRAVLVAEFAGERRSPSGTVYGDDPRWFVTFSPAPLPDPAGLAGPNENVSPHAGAVLRFNAPVDLDTARSLDTLFFATRDLLDPSAQQAFVRARGMDPATFTEAKYRTPHLVFARLFDVSGSRSTLRLQTPLGFYLDDVIRQADEGVPFGQKRFRYHLHVLGGADGLKDPAGIPLDLQNFISGRDYLVLPFSLDTRRNASGRSLFADNLAVSVARRFSARDEDEQPSYYLGSEVQAPGAPPNLEALPLEDVFGGVVLGADGTISGRPTGRARRIVDNLNQPPPPPQTSIARFCPEAVSGELQIPTATAGTPFGLPITDPTNRYGARLQTLWREIDMGLSRVDPFEFNLDVERLYLGVFQGGAVTYDEFERTSLYLGHSERRPEPCVGNFSALPTFAQSGLRSVFQDNYVFNPDPSGGVESQPAPHPAYVDRPLRTDPSAVVTEPNGVNRYVPLPAFQQPYFVWRDETVTEQGGVSGAGADVSNGLNNYLPYIASPSMQGHGRRVYVDPFGQTRFHVGTWDNRNNYDLVQRRMADARTGGGIGAIGLPLLADFQVLAGFPTSETPANSGPAFPGWQIALTVTSSPNPAFRAYSSGALLPTGAFNVGPGSAGWQSAQGGFTPLGNRTLPLDNSLYWVMADFLARRSVATAGFVDLLDPHRMPGAGVDVRLGPYLGGGSLPGNLKAQFSWFADLRPQLDDGAELTVEFRGAGAVDAAAWRAVEDNYSSRPDAANFPLDPLKAADAHIRKWDSRPVTTGTPRDYWTQYYNKNITDYTGDANDLMDPAFLARFAGPNEGFRPEDVRYVNWRLLMTNGDEPPFQAPRVDSLAVSYRFEPR